MACGYHSSFVMLVLCLCFVLIAFEFQPSLEEENAQPICVSGEAHSSWN